MLRDAELDEHLPDGMRRSRRASACLVEGEIAERVVEGRVGVAAVEQLEQVAAEGGIVGHLSKATADGDRVEARPLARGYRISQ